MSLFHRHRWEAVAVTHLMWFRTSLSGVRIGNPDDDTPRTEVLRRCGCGDVSTKSIAGSWTLAQVRGEEEA